MDERTNNDSEKIKLTSLEVDINRVWDLAVFLQMMSAFCKELDFYQHLKLMIKFEDFIKKTHKDEIKKNLPKFENRLTKVANSIGKKYPPKLSYSEIAHNWNTRRKLDKEIFSNGIMIGWLEEQIDLTNYYHYDYTPYHFKVGLVIHKGRGEIEENFLIQDSFTSLLKAENTLKLLDSFGKTQKEKFQSLSKKQYDKETLDTLNIIKYEVSFYSRIAIISYYSFLECFVNSIGVDYYYRNKNTINEKDAEILQGLKDGRFINCNIQVINATFFNWLKICKGV